jgi:4-hydroxy-tetrahydrodipicolinate synthase
MSDLITKLQGIVVPMVTPLTSEGDIDEDSLRSLTRYLVDAGVNGIFVMGTTGEFSYIDAEDQWSVVETVVEEVRHQTYVVAGVTGNSIEETVRNITILGALSKRPDALVVAPLCYHSNRKLPQHMARLCKVSSLPLLLYNNIDIVRRRWKRKDIIPEIVDQIAGMDKVIGIKDSSGNLNYLKQILSHQSITFQIFQGDESQILSAFQLGAVGAVPSIANIIPDVCVHLYNAFRADDIETVRKHQNTIVETHKLYLKYGNIPRILKEYLARKGVIKSGNSHPPFKGDIVSILDQVISKTRSRGI